MSIKTLNLRDQDNTELTEAFAELASRFRKEFGWKTILVHTDDEENVLGLSLFTSMEAEDMITKTYELEHTGDKKDGMI